MIKKILTSLMLMTTPAIAAECESVADMAESVAVARDSGASMNEVMTVALGSAPGRMTQEQAEMIRLVIEAVYQNPADNPEAVWGAFYTMCLMASND